MGSLWQDLRHAVRVLARNRGDTLAIAGLLALGLGAITVTFSLFDAILLRPLPVRRPEELVRIVQHLPKLGVQASFPYSYYQALHDHSTALAFTFAEAGKYYHFVMNEPA